MMVVDGRQADSRGVYLEELAIMMMEFNCDEAINLDGGGSSCMVADNRLLNRPAYSINDYLQPCNLNLLHRDLWPHRS